MQVPDARTYAEASELAVLFYGEMKRQQIKCYEIESMLGVSAPTARRWLQNPETAPMDTVARIAQLLGISKSTLCQKWRW